MQQTCSSCQTAFEISDDDLALLAKLSPTLGGKKLDLPPPKDCPNCRQQRRMSFRNERTLYRRKCDVTGKDIVSIFSPDSPYKVCDKDHWYSDKFDPLSYGREYDFDRPFFDQFKDLELEIPLPSLRVERSENCDFNNDMRDCKNCYLCSRTHESQDLLYTYRGNKSSNSVDCTQITKSEIMHECVECVKCYNGRYLFFCSECTDCSFMLDCRSCMSCFMCTNLRSKQYCFLNEQLTKDEYKKKLAEFDFGNEDHVQKAYKMFADIKKKTIQRNLIHVNADDSTGDNLFDCKGCHLCFGTQFSQDSRYLWDVKMYKDSMDAYSGGRDCELVYYTTAGAASYGVQFCLRTSECHDVLYSFFLNSSEYVFGSIGLKREKYCILNKQYSEEEYKQILPKIVEHMKSTGEWGDFFPPSLCPFAYNETVAQEYFPLGSKEAQAKGYRWKEDDPKDYKKQTYNLPNNITECGDDITDAVLACTSCRKNYKIVPQELAFYRDHAVAIPRFCPDCRHMRRLGTKNPLTLREDTCRKCNKSVTTTFPEGTEMQIYCESCYLEAVY